MPMSEITRQKLRLANVGKHHSKETRQKLSDIQKGKRLSEEHKRKIGVASSRHRHTEETKRKLSESRMGIGNPMYGKKLSKEHIEKIVNSRKGYIHSELTRKKISARQQQARLKPEWKKKASEAKIGINNPMFGKKITSEHSRKLSESRLGHVVTESTRKKIGERNRLIRSTPEWHIKQSKSSIKRYENYNERLKAVESMIGGFWYGNVRYKAKKKYCELWNRNLLDRIRAYWGNRSVISMITKEDNHKPGRPPTNLCCHHVYYQEKACCVWDEDVGGYYAMIDGEKYYIDGDPNKFVTLTNSENIMVNTDKLEWVKYFENWIKKQGGKCYYTKEEWNQILLANH